MKIKLLIRQILYSIRTVANEIYIVCKKQSVEAEILKTSHRLEKGLTLSKHRDLWGWDKANHLYQLLNNSDNRFAKDTALSVLYAYCEHKLGSNNSEDILRAQELQVKLQDRKRIDKYHVGGAIEIRKEDIASFDKSSIEKLFQSRHSIRDFDGTPVDIEAIKRAIILANRCPSACNRQPYRTYIIDNTLWQKVYNDSNQVYGADKHILITANMQAFELDELNDWTVSASVFAAYLTLTLTLEGLGCCVIRKPILYNPSIHELQQKLEIPNNEKIILELAVGNYKPVFKVAYSNRKNEDELITII